MRITRPFVLLALAALLAPRIEASRTSVWESNPPASLTATTTDAAGLLASLAPAVHLDTSTATDSVIVGSARFDLGDVVFADAADTDEERFDLGPLTLVDLNLLRGPPSSYPETRVGGFALLPPFRVGASASLSLWGRQACGSFSCEVVSDSRYDPWGLSFWSSIQGYVAGITEEADPTGLLPEVEATDAGYHTGSRDAEDFDASKTAGKWTLRGLTALKAGVQKAGKFGIKAITSALKSEAKEAATSFGAGVAGDLTEEALIRSGVDEELASVAGKLARKTAASSATKHLAKKSKSTSVRDDPTARRVKLRTGTRAPLESRQPRGPNGEMVDPHTGAPLKVGEIDVGHKDGQHWAGPGGRQEMHRKRGSTREEIIDAENDPDLYVLEDRGENRSHRHEKRPGRVP